MGARYDKEVLADSPIGYWPMDDDDTTILDRSGNGRNGTISGLVSMRRGMRRGGIGMKYYGVQGAGVLVGEQVGEAAGGVDGGEEVRAAGGEGEVTGGRVLREAAGGALFLPNITSLAEWATSIPIEAGLLPATARELSVLQAVTGEMPVKAAMDTAAKEAEDFLKGRGYYK